MREGYDGSLFEASMRVILQPVVEEYDKMIDACDRAETLVPDRLKKRIEKVLSRYRLRRITNVCVQIGRRVAIFIMVIITLMTVACVSIKPLRENIVEAIITWYDEYFALEFEKNESDTLYQAEVEFGYLPEGFIVTSNISTGEYHEILISYQDKYITYLKRPNTETEDYFDNNLLIEQLEIGQRKVIYMTDKNGMDKTFTWVENGSRVLLDTNISKEELVKIIENIK